VSNKEESAQAHRGRVRGGWGHLGACVQQRWWTQNRGVCSGWWPPEV